MIRGVCPPGLRRLGWLLQVAQLPHPYDVRVNFGNWKQYMPLQVLLVEDNPADVLLTQEAFREASTTAHIHVASDGVEAMMFLRREGAHAEAPRPDLIVLDLVLPRLDGRTILAYIKANESLMAIPTVILSGCEAEIDVVNSYKLHANSYLRKPMQWEGFKSLAKNIVDFWLTDVVLPQQEQMD